MTDQETMERFAREMAKKDSEIETLRSELRRQSQELRRAREALRKVYRVDENWCFYHGRPAHPDCDNCSIAAALTQPAPEKP